MQWWECSLPTNVAQVWFPDPASYVGWVCCLFSTLLWEVFLRLLRFSPLLKNQHFQIPIRFWNARTLLNEFLWAELLSALRLNKLHLHLHLHTLSVCQGLNEEWKHIASLLRLVYFLHYEGSKKLIFTWSFPALVTCKTSKYVTKETFSYRLLVTETANLVHQSVRWFSHRCRK